MIYRTTRLSETAAKSKKHICYGRPAAVYFSNEKVLIRWMAILVFLPLTLSIAVARIGCESALFARPSTVEEQRPELFVEESELQSPQPAVDPVFGPPCFTNLVREQDEQNTEHVAQNVEQRLWPDYSQYNDVYQGESAFWSDDVISNFFANVGQLLKKWIFEHCSGISILVGLAALFAVDKGFRCFVLLPARQWKLNINPTKSKANMVLLSNHRAWRNWSNR